MKPTPRDYLTIAAALLAILLCGYGIGFLVGEHTTRQRLAGDDETRTQEGDWESATLARLTRDLELDAGQQQQVAAEIKAAAGSIQAARGRALDDYHDILLQLHGRILPHLTEKQKRRVEESREALEDVLDKRRKVSDPVPRKE